MTHESKDMISGKKSGIKTAVLILAVLMTAGAVFTGAATAETGGDTSILDWHDWSDTTPNTLFYYEYVDGLTGTYSNMKETLRLDGMKVLDTVASHPEGVYLNGKLNHTGEPGEIQLKKLDAEITMYVHDVDSKAIIYSCIGDKVPQGASVSFKVNPNIPTLYNTKSDNMKFVGLKFIGPDGSGESTYLGNVNYGAGVDDRWNVRLLDSNLMEGKWTVWAYFESVPNTLGYFPSYTPDGYLNGQKYEFYITSSTASMTAESTTAEVGGYVAITISGKQNDVYYLKPNDKYEVRPGQQNVKSVGGDEKKWSEVTIGKDGTTTLYLKALKDGTFTLQLYSQDKTVVEDDLELTFTKAKITAEVEKDLYYMGTDVKLIGTNDALDTLYYYIEGTNHAFTQIPEGDLKRTKSSKEWETTIKGSYIKGLKLDTAAYTIFISNKKSNNKDEVTAASAVYTAVGVNLVKPEIRVTSAPNVVVHGDKLTVKGVADSTANVRYYIFGTNKFNSSTVDVGKNGAFTIETPIYKDDYNAGQYYVVLQHLMYDGNYNIAPVEESTGVWVIKLSNTGDVKDTPSDVKTLFSLNERQSANAAQALCDAIDSEDIDDICTKFSFIVTAEGTEIDPIQSQVIKGMPLTVSGSTNKVDGDPVIVELLSTMFNAASKYSATTASFITLTATPDKNGKWAVTFNTNNLNIDDYTITVTTGTVKSSPFSVKVVEGQIPIPANPSQTETGTQGPKADPVKPTEEAKSPGFGIAAVLAGLGAAVLLRKRV